MRYINITYHMYRNSETAETCITLPMDSRIADNILTNQCSSPHASPGSPVGCILSALADLQGYDKAAFRYAEERKICLWNDAGKENPDGK